ncbi:hypothetical protein [Curtobacterium sp. MCBD17_003]|uniref:hypothetical protein n=1 Tax=Curtobacterium sp. MCBD17_003 TaxID=2175667 RepID=UPI000DA9D765|nr:hypothetical protein [Curtobacterium sp. MCBD17_003]WIE54238.1 hypothetical protein DEI88_014105 [Curtobacterium sp. MCBD17_003]
MVATDPKLNQRRVWWERLLWLIDLAAYGFVGVSGVLAIGNVSQYVFDTLLGQRWIILLFAWLMTAGWVALAGRASRLWALEYVGNNAAGWGSAVYAVVLFPGALSGQATFAAFGMAVVATLFMVRRYAELVIFTSEPGDRDPVWFRAALRRRTKNTVTRQYY